MIRLVTQFDPPGTYAVDAAIPGGCCCCCCCCCLATTISASTVAGIQASRKASEATPPHANATLWVVVAASAMVFAMVAGVSGFAISGLAQSSSPVGLIVFGVAMVALWGALLWSAFRGVGFAHPARRAAVFVLIGVIAFGIEGSLGFYIILFFFPAYFLVVATVVGGVIWMATRPRVGSAPVDKAPPQ